MRKSTIMNKNIQAEEAGDAQGQAFWVERLHDTQQERHAERNGFHSYRVRDGDSLFSIAQQEYGDQRYAAKIARANQGIYKLYQGMVLRLPPKDEEKPRISPQEWEHD